MPAKTPEQQAAYDAARRRPVQVTLRLSELEAQELRTAAAALGVSLSDYVVSQVHERPAPVVDLAQVAQLSAVVATLASIPKAVRDLEADLGRFSGRLSHFFTQNPPLAAEYRSEINEVFWSVRDLLAKVQPEIQRVQVLVAEPRAAIGQVMKQLMGAFSGTLAASRKTVR